MRPITPRETIGVSLKSVYNKLDNVEPNISAALVRTTAQRPGGGRHGDRRCVATAAARLPRQDPRRQPSRVHRASHQGSCTIRAGALPGQSLVVLDPSLMLAIDEFPCEDGHAQERSLLGQVLETVSAHDVWIDDRNFCTTGFLFGILRRKAFFVTRQHGSTLHWQFVGKRRACGRIDTGKVFEQKVRLSDPDTGEIVFVRRITVVLDKPTRDGDAEIHILSNLPVKDARAKTIADLYRTRWTIADRLPGNGGEPQRRDQHAGLSQGGVVRVQPGVGVVQPDECGQGSAARVHGGDRPGEVSRRITWPTKSR